MNTQIFINEEHRDSVCKMGKGHETCRYLTFQPEGFTCEKGGPLQVQLDARGDTMNARGDNCDGWNHV